MRYLTNLRLFYTYYVDGSLRCFPGIEGKKTLRFIRSVGQNFKAGCIDEFRLKEGIQSNKKKSPQMFFNPRFWVVSAFSFRVLKPLLR